MYMCLLIFNEDCYITAHHHQGIIMVIIIYNSHLKTVSIIAVA